jgi:hypothetical protein
VRLRTEILRIVLFLTWQVVLESTMLSSTELAGHQVWSPRPIYEPLDPLAPPVKKRLLVDGWTASAST